MSEADQSYWNFDALVTGVVTPRDILEEQATQLKLQSGGLLNGRVVTSTSEYGEMLVHALIVRAPALEYSYQLLEIEHPADLFPVTVHAEDKSDDVNSMEKFKDKIQRDFEKRADEENCRGADRSVEASPRIAPSSIPPTPAPDVYFQIGLPDPGRPRRGHFSVTVAMISSLMRILRPHCRLVSGSILVVASRPILLPNPSSGEAKSR